MMGRSGEKGIHDSIGSNFLGRGSNTKTARVQLGRSGEPPFGGPGGRSGRAGAEWGAVYSIHDNFSRMWLGRGDNA